MTELEFKNILNNDINLINRQIIKLLPDARMGQEAVVNAMKYSLTNGGKRIRPVLVLEFAKACGVSREEALDVACAIEYIHTYSLIHDDLPCMDDDDMRRGKPSCHKEYGEANALLAGDALLTHAFEIIASSNMNSEAKIKAISLLSQNSGVNGMIGGQVIDLKLESLAPEINDLITTYKLKTGALISAACLLGCLCADATDEQLVAASKFAYSLGVAFQIQDDILDIIGNEEELGKPVGSDAENNKTTYAAIRGIEQSKKDIENLTKSAIKQLDFFNDNEFLRELAISLVYREK